MPTIGRDQVREPLHWLWREAATVASATLCLLSRNRHLDIEIYDSQIKCDLTLESSIPKWLPTALRGVTSATRSSCHAPLDDAKEIHTATMKSQLVGVTRRLKIKQYGGVTRDAQEQASPWGPPSSSSFLFPDFFRLPNGMHFGSVSSAPAQELSLDGASSYVKKLQLPSTSAAHLSGLIQQKKRKNDGSHPWDNF